MLIKIMLTLAALIALFFVVGKTVNPEDLRAAILNFPKDTLLLIMVLSFLVTALKAWRFYILLKNVHIKITFWETLKTFIASQTTTILPGGETLRGVLVKHEAGVPLIKTSGPVITQVYLEIVAATLIALLGSFIFKILRVPALLVTILVGGLTFFLVSARFSRKIIHLIPHKELKNKIHAKFEISQKGIHQNFFDKDLTIYRAFSLSIASNLLGGVILYIICRTFSVDLNILQALFIYSSSIVISGIGGFLPGGIGITEGGMLGIFSVLNVDVTRAVGIILIFRLVTLMFNIVLGAIFLVIFYSKDLMFKNRK